MERHTATGVGDGRSLGNTPVYQQASSVIPDRLRPADQEDQSLGALCGRNTPSSEALVRSTSQVDERASRSRVLTASSLMTLSLCWKPVENLRTVSSCYGGHIIQYPFQPSREHIPLAHFVHDVLKYSQTDFITLRLAQSYIERIGNLIPLLVAEHLSNGQNDSERKTDTADCMEYPSSRRRANPSFLLCPRRVFFTSLMVATKFLRDRPYSTEAWAKLTGLSTREVGACERNLCQALDYKLWDKPSRDCLGDVGELALKPVVIHGSVYHSERF